MNSATTGNVWSRWICPDCGDAWEGRLLTPPTVPAPQYVFLSPAGGYHEGDAEWVRIGKPDT
jgi:hypothetical protein